MTLLQKEAPHQAATRWGRDQNTENQPLPLDCTTGTERNQERNEPYG